MDFDPRTLIGAAVGSVITAGAAWVGMIRRVDTKVDRNEFHDNLERRDTRIRDDLKAVLQKLDQQDVESHEHRASIADQLNVLARDIAVLKDRETRK